MSRQGLSVDSVQIGAPVARMIPAVPSGLLVNRTELKKKCYGLQFKDIFLYVPDLYNLSKNRVMTTASQYDCRHSIVLVTMRFLI